MNFFLVWFLSSKSQTVTSNVIKPNDDKSCKEFKYKLEHNNNKVRRTSKLQWPQGRLSPSCVTWDLHVLYLTNSVLSVHLFCIMDESQAQQQALLLLRPGLQLQHQNSSLVLWPCRQPQMKLCRVNCWSGLLLFFFFAFFYTIIWMPVCTFTHQNIILTWLK